MTTKKLERRFLATEVRLSDNGSAKTIEGYGAVFNSPSENLGGFIETLAPGCFTDCLKRGDDVRCLINHDASLLLGRTASGTLTLSQDSKGLKFRCTLPGTTYAADLRELIGRGDLSQCSFAFIVGEDKTEDANGANGIYFKRTILAIEQLIDVSAVTYPSYPQTSVTTNSLWPDGVPETVEQRFLTARQNQEHERLVRRRRTRLAEICADAPNEAA